MKLIDTIKQSRPRPLIPSPKIFRDKTKYDRRTAKKELQDLIEEETTNG